MGKHAGQWKASYRRALSAGCVALLGLAGFAPAATAQPAATALPAPAPALPAQPVSAGTGTEGDVSFQFAGVPGKGGATPGNTDKPKAADFVWAEWLPRQSVPASESPRGVQQGKHFDSVIQLVGDAKTGQGSTTYLVCQEFDNGPIALATSAAYSSRLKAQAWSARRNAVWLGGYYNGAYFPEMRDAADFTKTFRVEYGGAQASCDGSDGWYSQPSKVPGNDNPSDYATEFTAVDKVRYVVTLP